MACQQTVWESWRRPHPRPPDVAGECLGLCHGERSPGTSTPTRSAGVGDGTAGVVSDGAGIGDGASKVVDEA